MCLCLCVSLSTWSFLSSFKVQQVSASDPDAGANGQFTYSIHGGDPDDVFEIDGKAKFVLLFLYQFDTNF